MSTRYTTRIILLLLSLGVPSAATSATHDYEKTFTYCRDVDSYLVTPPEWGKPQAPQEESANNDFSPVPDGLLRLLKANGNVLSPTTIKKLGLTVTVLRPPKHGKIKDVMPPDVQHATNTPDGRKVLLPLGTTSYHYTFMPNLGYLGKDYVEYEVMANQKRYKVVVNFLVVPVVNGSGPLQCSSEKFNN